MIIQIRHRKSYLGNNIIHLREEFYPIWFAVKLQKPKTPRSGE